MMPFFYRVFLFIIILNYMTCEKFLTKTLDKGSFCVVYLHRKRDAMRPNRHITPLFRFFGQWLKAGFRRFAEMVSFKLSIPSLAWHHPQLRSCPRRNSNRPSFLDEIWHLGKNKFIKPFSSPLQGLAVGGGETIIRRRTRKKPLQRKAKRCGKHYMP